MKVCSRLQSIMCYKGSVDNNPQSPSPGASCNSGAPGFMVRPRAAEEAGAGVRGGVL